MIHIIHLEMFPLQLTHCIHTSSHSMHIFISSIIHIINTTTSSIISYIIYPIHRKYDPYPCILGIPVMPALFSTCKFYIFVSFTMIGTYCKHSDLRTGLCFIYWSVTYCSTSVVISFNHMILFVYYVNSIQV